MKYNRWTVITLYGNRADCRCDCGTERNVSILNLRNGRSKSCGCLPKEICSRIKRKHGHSVGGKASKTYVIWAGMLRRVRNVKDKSYPRYGGRGISVCERWTDFSLFLEDMGPCPPGHSIERKDNNGNYEPDNCEWIPMTLQSRNKRDNISLYVGGEKMCAREAATRFCIPYKTLLWRIHAGWSQEDAINRPVRR